MSFAQGRNLDVDGGEAIIEVLAEPSLLDGCGDIHVCGSHDAYICLARSAAADPQILACFQDSKQSGLCTQRQFAHFIKEECASVGSSEEAFVLAYGAGERAFLVSEEFAVDGSFWYGAAVYCDVCLASTLAVVVDDAWNDFLTHAALALYEYREVCRSNENCCGKGFAKGFVASHNAVAVHQGLHI